MKHSRSYMLHGWTIEYNPKPIPIRDFDYDFWHEENDVDAGLSGCAASVEDALRQIEDIEAER